jgi:hypothetical protein
MSGLLAACGDEDPAGSAQQAALTHDQYQQSIWDIRGGENASSASRLYFDVVGDLGKKDCSVKTHALHDSLAAMLRQVEGLRPPEEAESAQRDFLEAAAESVRLVGVAADDVDSGGLTCGRAMNDRIYDMPSTKQAEKAIEDLTKLNYNVLGS